MRGHEKSSPKAAFHPALPAKPTWMTLAVAPHQAGKQTPA
jgi:hypothetical protein